MTTSAPPGFRIASSSSSCAAHQRRNNKDGASLASENLTSGGGDGGDCGDGGGVYDAIDSVVLVTNAGRSDDDDDDDDDDVDHNRLVVIEDVFVHGIDLRFPKDLDFLCLCEVFDKGAAKTVRDKLSDYFPYVVYDIAARPCFRFCNSGLLFASRYPIVDVEFRKYGAHEGSDSMACKGILHVKLRVGRLKDGTDVVAFINQTHIQARVSEKSGDFQLAQLDLAVEDIRRFRAKNADNEIVAFQVLSGDLNFDSISDSDETRWAHPLFTQLFVDPCRCARLSIWLSAFECLCASAMKIRPYTRHILLRS